MTGGRAHQQVRDAHVDVAGAAERPCDFVGALLREACTDRLDDRLGLDGQINGPRGDCLYWHRTPDVRNRRPQAGARLVGRFARSREHFFSYLLGERQTDSQLGEATGAHSSRLLRRPRTDLLCLCVHTHTHRVRHRYTTTNTKRYPLLSPPAQNRAGNGSSPIITLLHTWSAPG